MQDVFLPHRHMLGLHYSARSEITWKREQADKVYCECEIMQGRNTLQYFPAVTGLLDRLKWQMKLNVKV